MSVVPEEFRVQNLKVNYANVTYTSISFAILLGKGRVTGNFACRKRNSVNY